MEIKPENIKVINYQDIQTYQDVIDNDNLVMEIISSLKKCFEINLGEMTQIEVRNDLLHKLHLDVIPRIGGNTNPAFCRITNMSNKNHKIVLMFALQKQEPPIKKKTTIFGKLIDKLKKIFWSE
jgi:hypothetical protein